VTRQELVRRMLDLGRECGDIPIYGSAEWEALDNLDPRRFASVVRAAEVWRREGDPDRIKQRLAEEDWLVRYRIRQAGLDVHGRGDTNWICIHDVVRARAAYRERYGVAS
jgi:Protein of unknown function (DUF2742)